MWVCILFSIFKNSIKRERGNFNDVAVSWSIYADKHDVEKEFKVWDDVVIFTEGQILKNLTIHALKDGVPEIDEDYLLKITDSSGD